MLLDALINKFSNNQLSPFYVLSCPLDQSRGEEFLKSWVNEFLAKALVSARKDFTIDKASKAIELGHADIEFISTKNKTYTLKGEEFDEFFKFLSYSRHELSRKFIVVWDAYKITEILANKLLKTLEEPPVDTTIFFVDPRKSQLLPTISSRAIHLKIPISSDVNTRVALDHQSFSTWLESRQDLKEDPIACALSSYESSKIELFELFDALKSKSVSDENVINVLMSWLRETNTQAKMLERVINRVKIIEEQRVYNGALQNRLAPLINEVFKR